MHFKTKGYKPNKIWVDQGREFYNNFLKRFLEINNIQMYSTYNEGKPVIAARFIRTLKNKIFKHMTAISQMCQMILLINTNNTVHRTIKMKPIEITSDSYAEYNKDSNEKDPKSKVGDHVRISKYKNIFVKGYAPNWSEEVFGVSKTKNTVPWTTAISDLNGEEVTRSFYEKELQKTSQKNLEQKKYLKEKLINCMSNGKSMIVVLINGLIKKISYRNESILS